ncbi:MAG: prolyl oligopeptidase family serine peptidase [Alphaproteobacteria bacterium]|nr:prolyl oligopeptidase family serine peptidase [Alphaproteobacteria bacterium]MCZ6509382.1 prolyl oligopeptidase family serine peptidase [Alphaproteobacteria bacterium]MCZ6588057.1 prolyl oligopeptidase family serine peptidase [Alphaproteobacteria bacterium]MCZ6590001.1 prolyl oligopeptidase family serine peptidase [Alphaproteobacteria bacterium]MCZ6840617.1 prolyl oligopeptidase family serine peptidase [Alphaproteobacteria bacterium]
MPEHVELSGPAFAPASGGPAKQLVILLHGVGADGNDLIGLAPMLSQGLPDAEFLAPNAPEPCDMAPVGRQWFSLQDRSADVIEAGVRAAAPLVDKFIDDNCAIRQITPDRVALFGFSQGCMMSLFVGLRRQTALAAVLGYSGALVAPEKLAAEIVSRPPVLLVHGEADPVVPYQMLAAAQAGLEAAGVDVQTVSRPGLGHGIDEAGIREGAALLQRTLTA